METIITFVAEYAIEFALGGLIVFFRLIDKPKTAEKLAKIKEKNLTARERKQKQYLAKMKKNQIEIDKLNKELKKDA